jgi:hypothetical protein
MENNMTIPNFIEKSHLIFNKDMCTFDARFKTFEGWPTSKLQKPEQLAKCGFYFIGVNDKVRCYYCGLSLHKWEPRDVPWLEHALHSNQCAFLLMHKSSLKVVEEDDGTVLNDNVRNFMVSKIYIIFLSSIVYMLFLFLTDQQGQ